MDRANWDKRMAAASDSAGGDWAVGETPLPNVRSVLSADEIEALLRPDLSDMDAPAPPASVERKPLPALTTPDRDMEVVRRLTAGLSLALRRDCDLDAVVRPLGVRRAPFAEAAETFGQSAALCFANGEGAVVAMLALDNAAAGRLVELACGGRADLSRTSARPLTPMGADIVQSVLAPAATVFGIGASLVRVESRAEYAMALAPSGEARIVDLIFTLANTESRATLIVSDAIGATGKPAATDHADVTAVLTARLASLSVPASRLSRLKPGETLLLGLPPDQPVSLLSGGRDGKLAAEGDIGRKGAQMAVRVTRKVG